METSAEPGHTFSQQCCSCDSSSTSCWCVDCNEALCEACLSAHRRVTITRSHRILNQPPAGAAATPPTKFCRLHPSEPLKLFCFTCKKLTCRDCQLITHMNHRYMFVSEALVSLKKQMEILVQPIRVQRDTVRRSLQNMEIRYRKRGEVIPEKQKQEASRVSAPPLQQESCFGLRADLQQKDREKLLHILECGGFNDGQRSCNGCVDITPLVVSWGLSLTTLPTHFHSVSALTWRLRHNDFNDLMGVCFTPRVQGASASVCASQFSLLQDIVESEDHLTTQLQNSYRVLAEQMQKRMQDILNNVKEVSVSEMERIQTRMKKLKQLQQDHQSATEIVERARNSSDLSELLGYNEQVRAQLTNLYDQDLSPPQTMSQLKVVSDRMALKSILNFGELQVLWVPFSVAQASSENTASSSSQSTATSASKSLSSQLSASRSESLTHTLTCTSSASLATSNFLANSSETLGDMLKKPSQLVPLKSTVEPISTSVILQPVVASGSAPKLIQPLVVLNQQTAPPTYQPAPCMRTNTLTVYQASCFSELPLLLSQSRSYTPPAITWTSNSETSKETVAKDQKIRGCHQLLPVVATGNQISVRPHHSALQDYKQTPEHQPLPAYRLTPEHQPLPAYRLTPEHQPLPAYKQTPEHQPLPAYRLTPEHQPLPSSKQTPEHQPLPSYKQTPEHQPLPSYKQTPEHQPLPSYKQTPEHQPLPAYRLTPEHQPLPSYKQTPEHQPLPAYKQTPEHQLVHSKASADITSCLQSSPQRLVCDISPCSSSVKPQQPSPVVRAVADSACDSSVQQVTLRQEEPAENEPTSTVSEEPEPEEKPPTPAVSDIDTEEPSSVTGCPDFSMSQWQPRVSLYRLPLGPSRPGSPLPGFRLVPGDAEDEIYLEEMSEDSESYNDDITDDFIEPPSSPESPLTLQIVSCSACGSANASIICSACGRGYHRGCHVPPVGRDIWKEWSCSLCQDLTDLSDPYSSDRPPQSPTLSLLDQRRCESLLLYLKVEGCSLPSQFGRVRSRLKSMTERLTLHRPPAYQTSAELLYDIWRLFKDAAQDDGAVNKLQESFQNRVTETFSSGLHPAVLNLPSSSRHTHTLMSPGGEGEEEVKGPKVTSQEEEVDIRDSRLNEMKKRLRKFMDLTASPRAKRRKTDT
uniref:tripartite motif-containing protein 66 n=1 Tax=Semicossyphus pulcher TaxID=241346 RepID=UPI0037E966DB